jgi:hypothetical protein
MQIEVTIMKDSINELKKKIAITDRIMKKIGRLFKSRKNSFIPFYLGRNEKYTMRIGVRTVNRKLEASLEQWDEVEKKWEDGEFPSWVRRE